MFSKDLLINSQNALLLFEQIIQQQAEINDLERHKQKLLDKIKQQQSRFNELKLLLSKQQQMLTKINSILPLQLNTPTVTGLDTDDTASGFLEIISLLIDQVFPKSLFEYKIARIINKPQFVNHKTNTPKLKVATILDEFSCQSLASEFDLLQLHPARYKQQIEQFNPDLIFIESAWFGHEQSWKRRESIVGRPVNSLLNYCDSRELLTVFWNKEDPVDFEHFLPLAKRCDIVLTTDEICVTRYKSVLSHERIYSLPFAVQPRLHNPTKEFIRQDRCCFAGAFYEKFPNRQRDLDKFIKIISKQLPVDIYDRNFNSKDIYNPPFPEQYKPYIKGTLKFKAVNKAYKAYKLAININTVKTSPTMFSRRVFELAASNTVILSNYSSGIRELFGNTIFSSDKEAILENYLQNITQNDRIRRKVNLLALRQVMKNHTYEDRVIRLKELITGKPITAYFPQIFVVAIVSTMNELNSIQINFQRQTFINKQLLIITNMPVTKSVVNKSLFFVTKEQCTEFLDTQKTDSFIAFFAVSDYYGKNYLQDLILATRYTNKNMIAYGKSSYFGNHQGRCKLFQNDLHYQLVNKLYLRCSIVKLTHILHNPLSYLTHTTIIKNLPMYGIDEFNYCRNTDQIKRFNPEFVDDINPSELYHE